MIDISALLHSISQHTHQPEPESIHSLLAQCHDYDALWPRITEHARAHILRLRRGGFGISVESFLEEYGLSSKEGVAVMCLAEALLRIPDSRTADALIDASFEGAEWDKHVGQSDSLFVNASSWGLLLTGKVLAFEREASQPVGKFFAKIIQKTGEPIIREALKRAMRLIASQFVMGETVEDCVKKAPKWMKDGYRFSYDMLGEGARSPEQANRYFVAYAHAIEIIAAANKTSPAARIWDAPSISIKLTALHPRYEWRKLPQLRRELLPKLKELVLMARAGGIAVAVDAEEAARLDLELALFAELFQDKDLDGYEGLGFVLQAYQKRAIHVVDYLQQLSAATGRRMAVRLVKGAYWDSEIKAAQIASLPDYPVFTRKCHSDVSYLACAKKLLAAPTHFYPQFATHNAVTISAIQEIAAADADYEFQRLYGMGEALYVPIVKEVPCRIYAPIGEHQDLLAYLIRRLLENGANSSFVNQILDEDVPVESLLDNPLRQAREHGGEPGLRLPGDIFADRANSPGLDMGCRAIMEPMQKNLQQASAGDAPTDSTTDEVAKAMEQLHQGFISGAIMPLEQRATALEHMADLLIAQRDEVFALLMSEAGKVLADAVAEWREAIDFCRYYAMQSRRLFAPHRMASYTGEENILSLHGRGVFCCISPWNFPLAIYLGQISAALAAGNTVIAKPAEQTPRIAAFALSLLREAGFTENQLQQVYGGGEIGAAMIAHPACSGVAFTGSTEVAKIIQRQLAAKDGAIVPLIAETGGQNVMIVDASALLEQAVDDIIHSAFGSAGQRCSALRILCVQRDIADDLIALLSGAMQSLQLGDVRDVATDIGGVIDSDAEAILDEHLQWLTANAKHLATAPLPAGLAGHMVAPAMYEINGIEQLQREHFGPILHVLRYDAAQLDALIEQIHATGYGLTFGVHSRIHKFSQSLAERMRVGNVYINRSMTGAVVGVQPFGGEGLSGTGPKAGSPFTLLRYASEKHISTNTTAIGGNLDLLMN